MLSVSTVGIKFFLQSALSFDIMIYFFFPFLLEVRLQEPEVAPPKVAPRKCGPNLLEDARAKIRNMYDIHIFSFLSL